MTGTRLREARRFLADWWFQFCFDLHPLVELCKKAMFLPGHYVFRIWKPFAFLTVLFVERAFIERDCFRDVGKALLFLMLGIAVAFAYVSAALCLGIIWPMLLAAHALYFFPLAALALGIRAAFRVSDRLYGKSPARWWRRKRAEVRAAAATALARGRERLAARVARVARRARVEAVNWAHYLRFIAGRRARRLASRLGFPA